MLRKYHTHGITRNTTKNIFIYYNAILLSYKYIYNAERSLSSITSALLTM